MHASADSIPGSSAGRASSLWPNRSFLRSLINPAKLSVWSCVCLFCSRCGRTCVYLFADRECGCAGRPDWRRGAGVCGAELSLCARHWKPRFCFRRLAYLFTVQIGSFREGGLGANHFHLWLGEPAPRLPISNACNVLLIVGASSRVSWCTRGYGNNRVLQRCAGSTKSRVVEEQFCWQRREKIEIRNVCCL